MRNAENIVTINVDKIMYRLTHSRSTAASCWSGERADYQQTSSEYGTTTAGRETAMYIQGGQKNGPQTHDHNSVKS